MMTRLSHSTLWPLGVFRLTVALCLLFVLLTVVAMLLYPGGTIVHPHLQGYSFFLNFLSDLGRTVTPSGQSNLVSRVLFTLALSLGALGLAPFFVAHTTVFAGSGTSAWLSRLGAAFGVVTSLGFLGVAWVPINLYEALHNGFLDTAFLSFLLAFVLLFLAMVLTPGFPRRCLWILSAFAVLLAGYLPFLLFGPAAGTPAWELLQATGQKLIVSASILVTLLEALSIQPWLRKQAALPSPL